MAASTSIVKLKVETVQGCSVFMDGGRNLLDSETPSKFYENLIIELVCADTRKVVINNVRNNQLEVYPGNACCGRTVRIDSAVRLSVFSVSVK